MANKPDDLEALLRARLADPRAMSAALSINANRVFLTFGAAGEHRRIVLQVKGDALEVVSRPAPAPDPEDDGDGEAAEPQTSAVDPAKHTKADLAQMAADAGIEVKNGDTKTDIASAINSAAAGG